MNPFLKPASVLHKRFICPSLNCRFIHWLNYWFIYCFIHWFKYWLSYWFIFINSLVRLLIRSLVLSLVYTLVQLSIELLVHIDSFIGSFINSLVHSLVYLLVYLTLHLTWAGVKWPKVIGKTSGRWWLFGVPADTPGSDEGGEDPHPVLDRSGQFTGRPDAPVLAGPGPVEGTHLTTLRFY